MIKPGEVQAKFQDMFFISTFGQPSMAGLTLLARLTADWQLSEAHWGLIYIIPPRQRSQSVWCAIPVPFIL